MERSVLRLIIMKKYTTKHAYSLSVLLAMSFMNLAKADTSDSKVEQFMQQVLLTEKAGYARVQ